MVVGLALAAVQMGMALPTGFLFGVGYGTGVRIGYEQVYPLLFPKGARSTTSELAATMKGMNTVYDAIGGKDASRMGIAVGITNAGEILNNPDFRVLEQLESSLSGLTSSNSNRSRYGLDQESPQQVVSSEIEQFNITSGANWYTKFRAFSITQIRNWQSGTGHNPQGLKISHIVLREKLNTQDVTDTTPVTNIPTPTPSPTPQQLEAGKKLREDQEWRTWSAKLAKLKQQYQFNANQQRLLGGKSSSANQAKVAKIININRGITSQARQMSNDYRHPNNNIRQNALRLRQAFASGKWWQ